MTNEKKNLALSRREYGSGEAVVIVHGLLGSKENWYSVAQELSTEYRVIVPDLRNHGDSPHAQSMDYADMAGDLHAVVESVGEKSVHLIGHSLGAKVVLQYAMLWPEAAGKIILVDMVAKKYRPKHTAILEALLSVPSGEIGRRSEVDALLAEKIPNPLVRAFLLKGMRRGEDGKLRWRMNVSQIAHNYQTLGRQIELIPQPDREILLIFGGRSDYVEPKDRETLRTYFPRLETQAFERAGHWVHTDVREDFIASVKMFLKR